MRNGAFFLLDNGEKLELETFCLLFFSFAIDERVRWIKFG